MSYDPILKEVLEISHVSYFKLQRLKFWQMYAQLKGLDKVDPNWFKKDGYTYPYMQDIDLETGEYKMVSLKASLHSQLENDIHTRFQTFKFRYERQLLEYDKDFKKVNFQILIIKTLEKIKETLELIDVDEVYLTPIKNAFGVECKIFSPESSIDISVSGKRGYQWQFQYKKIKSENGKISFKSFFDGLRDHNLIASDTNYHNFKKFFQGELPTKIMWVGSKAQLISFIKILVSKKDIIESENHWVATENSFKVFKNGVKEYELKKLHTGTELTKPKKLEELNMIIAKL